MTTVSDSFQRANGSLGSNWQSVVACAPGEGQGSNAGGILINGNGYGPINASGGDAASLWGGGQSFGNDQWASAVLNTFAGPTATLSITAATQSGGNTTYTYTVASGSVASPISGGFLYVIISGMQNAGNNGHFTATTFGSGTFTVANASGVTESGSSGSGFCSSDSGAGVMVRGSGTQQSNFSGYFFHIGSNSSSGDGRTCFFELWRIINGSFTGLGNPNNVYRLATLSTTFLPKPGDVISLSAVGSTITAYYNGLIFAQATDTNITSGVPGITSWSANGQNEYNWSNYGTVSLTGNNGTTFKNWSAGDTPFVPAPYVDTQLGSDSLTEGNPTTQLLSDSLAYSNGDLHSSNANWAYQNTSKFNIASNDVYAGGGQGFQDFAYRSDQVWPNDQYAQVTAVVTGAVSTQNFGPAVRISSSSETGYYVRYANNGFDLNKIVNGGSAVQLASFASFPVTGDVIKLQVVGNALTVFKNGVFVMSAVDSSISSGNSGIHGAATAGNQTVNGASAWSGGSASAFSSQFTQESGIFLSDPTFGVYAAALAGLAATAFQNSIAQNDNQYSQVKMTGSTATSHVIGAAVEVSSSTASAYVFYADGAGNATINKLVSGAFVGAFSQSVAYTFHQNDIFKLEKFGTTLIGSINGTKVLAIDDTSGALLTGGQPGWAAVNNTGNPATPAGTISTWVGGSVSFNPNSNPYYSVPDCRTITAITPNSSRNVQGTLVYDVSKVDSRTGGAPVDSRTGGAPVDSRASGNAPQNSRTPGVYGPGVN